MAEKKKILYMVEAMGGGVFTYIVDLANELVDTYDMYIAYTDFMIVVAVKNSCMWFMELIMQRTSLAGNDR